MKDNISDFQILSDVRFRMIADEGVIIRQEIGEALLVNEVGARILEMLKDGVQTVDLIERLTQEFDIGHDQLTQDVYHYLTALEAAGVVEKTVPVEPAEG